MDSSNILTRHNVQSFAKRAAAEIPEYKNIYVGKGIITCAGSRITLYNLYFLVRTLRHFGNNTLLECWHLPKEIIPDKLRFLYAQYNVLFIEAKNFNLGGWELKSHAVLHSSFKEILFLDADNLVSFDVQEILEEEIDQFWPDFGFLHKNLEIYKFLDMSPKILKCFEAGQFKINKEKSWKALNFCNWINQNSNFFYKQKIWGDKDTFNLAWNKFNTPFILHKNMEKINGIFIQDYKGKKFYHQNQAKKVDSSDFFQTIPFHSLLNEWKEEYIDWLLSNETSLFKLSFNG